MVTPRRLAAQHLHERLQAPHGDLILVDVRTRREWQHEGHIEGAVLIPIDELQARAAAELPRDAEIVVYCHAGVRSQRAAYYLAQVGYTHVADLVGGLEGWQRSRLPVIYD